MEYNFKFYDSVSGDIKTLNALVTKVYEDQIRVKYMAQSTSIEVDNADCSKCSKENCSNRNTFISISRNEEPMPTCNCILNPPDISKYDEPRIYFIPIQNILNVSYIKNSDENIPVNTNRNEGTRVMLLGISATTLKAIVIKLEFFDDSVEDAVKLVELRAGGIYDLAYETKDGTIYESRVMIKHIEEVDSTGEGPCKPGKGFVRENVGMNNFVYTNCCHKKDDFIDAPPAKRVKIIVDTSEDFHGRYECIMLDSIRNCTAVNCSNYDNDFIETECVCDCCEFKTEFCTPGTCGHYIPTKQEGCNCNSKEYNYTYDNKFKCTVSGENVTIFARGEKCEITLDALLKYYLGVD